jgi:hypothetical protein
LIKLSEIKKVRAGLKWQDPHNRSFQSEYSPESNPFDNIFTILICNKFDFVFDISKINYGKTRQQYKHNLVLSLNDGLLHYKKSGSSTSLYFPFNKDNVHVNEFLKNDKSDLPKTIKIFLSSLYSILNLTSILNIDMGLYLFDEKDVVDKIA